MHQLLDNQLPRAHCLVIAFFVFKYGLAEVENPHEHRVNRLHAHMREKGAQNLRLTRVHMREQLHGLQAHQHLEDPLEVSSQHRVDTFALHKIQKCRRQRLMSGLKELRQNRGELAAEKLTGHVGHYVAPHSVSIGLWLVERVPEKFLRLIKIEAAQRVKWRSLTSLRANATLPSATGSLCRAP